MIINRGWDLYLLFSLPFIFLFIIPGLENSEPARLFGGVILGLFFHTQVLIRRIVIEKKGIKIQYPYSLIRKDVIHEYSKIASVRISQGVRALSQPTAFISTSKTRPLVIRIPQGFNIDLLISTLRQNGVIVNDTLRP